MQDLKRPDLIRIATCFSAIDAGFLASYMEAHGVHVEKTNDYFVYAAPVYSLTTGGVELWIRGHDARFNGKMAGRTARGRKFARGALGDDADFLCIYHRLAAAITLKLHGLALSCAPIGRDRRCDIKKTPFGLSQTGFFIKYTPFTSKPEKRGILSFCYHSSFSRSTLRVLTCAHYR